LPERQPLITAGTALIFIDCAGQFRKMLGVKVASKSLKDWLKLFSRAVRERDMISGRKLFHRRVVSFGTVCFRADNLNELIRQQWQIVWPDTQNFDFHYETARALVDGKTAALIADWESFSSNGHRKSVSRSGRATIVLKKTVTGWKAVHTHFSIDPFQNDPVLRHTGASWTRARVP
jgi:ketosteroid isomerase-like protein